MSDDMGAQPTDQEREFALHLLAGLGNNSPSAEHVRRCLALVDMPAEWVLVK